ncbi:MAG: hypothetical protein P8Y99_08945 [Calditrichaceae bacterium]
MKRRNFLKKSIAAAGIVGSAELLLNTSQTLASTGTTQTDNRPAEYLRRVQEESFIPYPPAPARSYPVSPMPLSERVGKKIVPQRGFCSIAPGNLVNQALTCGNGVMNI